MLERFGEYAKRWLDEAVHLRETTRDKYRGHLHAHLLPAFGERPVDAIQPSHVQSWVASLVRAGMSAGTVKTVFTTFRAILNSAELNRLVERSPCIGVKLPKDDERREMRFLAPEQVAKLAEIIDARYRALIYVAAYSGCRFGELAFLKTDAVNVLAGRIEIRGSLAEIGGRLVPQGTKTSRWRSVTLTRPVAQMLGEHIGRFPSAEGHVFSAPRRGPLRRRSWERRFFKPAVSTAGLEPLRFHDLRHTHAALLSANRMPVKVIADRLGHAKPTMTMDAMPTSSRPSRSTRSLGSRRHSRPEHLRPTSPPDARD